MTQLLKQLLSEGDGSPSTMRVATVVVVLGVMVPFAVISIKQGAFVKLDYELVALILGALGIKAVQRSIENKTPEPPKGPSTGN